MHPGFFRSAIALAMIAALAAGNQIIPRRLSATRTRHHVIQRQLRRRKLFAAILTTRMIAEQDILARERTPLERDMPVLSQANHRRSMQREFLGMEHVPVVLFHARYALKDHHYRAPFSAHVDGFKRGV